MNRPDVEQRHLPAAEREMLLRERLAASRADLLARSVALKAESRRGIPSLPARGLELVCVAPNVTLLAAVLAGALILGPRKIAAIVVRNGLAGWIAKNVRLRAGQ
ncbi:hypothetical protein PPMP20_21700 [Paraburkholderia phymatum]|uniref:Transmembrane protein n=1 Tax=Paraburkholderia phymatum (strain DSM 17167 / CIP 108236 / LMG 21445 / STM815) TaxID=391038 RepID=B2JMV4_PARP8|nr:hypothetical protein [Paraburkholderia phymatum]ACC74347.1 hypothetical protein Bphy_5267 [Paraburkholderia phymatum STM815]